MTLEAAYAACRTIARREAQNFYYSFRVLPRPKMDAMCAVYAFMRQADDIADDESQTLEARRSLMRTWMAAWRASRAGGTTDDFVFLALGDTQARFSIPDALLEDLVRGTSMDLEAGSSIDLGNGLQGYETFDDLYRYCYLVASVVGLVCIRIFGYSDPAAEAKAERNGIAFQLTNILRDVKEDVERGRIYIFSRTCFVSSTVYPNRDISWRSRKARAVRANRSRTMLMALEIHAGLRLYCQSRRQLIPLLNRDSSARACGFWCEIYHAVC